MAFRPANITAHLMKFNSAVSSDFLDLYQDTIDQDISKPSQGPKHRTFAPSQMRCDRISWFRLRGTQPDKVTNPDRGLEFTANIGTACHEIIQDRLSRRLKDDWIEVQSWIDSNPELFSDYEYEIKKEGFESKINLIKPFPVRFACDGIVRFHGKIYLLEIKTAEFSSLMDLIEPKPKHMDQVKCYSTLLKIPDVLFLYQDRQHGELKCFEVHFSLYDQECVRSNMQRIMDLAEANIAPEGLPVGDPDCSPSMCDYYKVCKEWGR